MVQVCQQMAKVFLAFWEDCPAGPFGKAEDFLKLLVDDHRDLLECLIEGNCEKFVTQPFQSTDARST